MIIFVSFPLFYKILNLISKKGLSNKSSEQKAIDTVNLVKKISSIFFIKNCLTQSFVSFYLLNQQGYKASFCIGIRKEDGELKSHSWLELGNIPLGEHKEISNFKKIKVFE